MIDRRHSAACGAAACGTTVAQCTLHGQLCVCLADTTSAGISFIKQSKQHSCKSIHLTLPGTLSVRQTVTLGPSTVSSSTNKTAALGPSKSNRARWGGGGVRRAGLAEAAAKGYMSGGGGVLPVVAAALSSRIVCTLGQRLGQLHHQRMHFDACCPDACAKVHIPLFLCGSICDHNLPRLHLIHLHNHRMLCFWAHSEMWVGLGLGGWVRSHTAFHPSKHFQYLAMSHWACNTAAAGWHDAVSAFEAATLYNCLVC